MRNSTFKCCGYYRYKFTFPLHLQGLVFCWSRSEPSAVNCQDWTKGGVLWWKQPSSTDHWAAVLAKILALNKSLLYSANGDFACSADYQHRSQPIPPKRKLGRLMFFNTDLCLIWSDQKAYASRMHQFASLSFAISILEDLWITLLWLSGAHRFRVTSALHSHCRYYDAMQNFWYMTSQYQLHFVPLYFQSH